MYQIGRNAHIDHLRSRRPEISLDSAWEQEAQPAAPAGAKGRERAGGRPAGQGPGAAAAAQARSAAAVPLPGPEIRGDRRPARLQRRSRSRCRCTGRSRSCAATTSDLQGGNAMKCNEARIKIADLLQEGPDGTETERRPRAPAFLPRLLAGVAGAARDLDPPGPPARGAARPEPAPRFLPPAGGQPPRAGRDGAAPAARSPAPAAARPAPGSPRPCAWRPPSWSWPSVSAPASSWAAAGRTAPARSSA